jgi:hypothetical protein
MNRVLFPSVVVTALLIAAAPALAAERTVWVGRDLDNNKVFWTCSNVGSNNWQLKKNDTLLGEYEGVTSTSEFVELQLKGSKQYDRVRLYKDNLSLNKEGSRTEWIQMAKGKWAD